MNAPEDEQYADEDLDDPSGKKEITAEQLKKVQEMNQRLKQKPEDKKLAEAVKTLERDLLHHRRKYEEQERKLASRNSYSKTDEDATFMRMNEDRGGERVAAQADLQPANGHRKPVCDPFQCAPAPR